MTRVTDVTGRPKPKRRKDDDLNLPPMAPVAMLAELKRQLVYMAEGLDTHLAIVQKQIKAITQEVNEIQCDLQDERAAKPAPKPPPPPPNETTTKGKHPRQIASQPLSSCDCRHPH